jgi:hypothetical protein
MVGRSIITTVCGLALSLGALNTVLAQSAVGAPKDTAGLTSEAAGTAAAIPSIKSAADLPVWKMITLGNHRNVNGLLEDLDSLHCGRGDHTRSERGPFVPGTMIPLPCVLGESAGEIIARPTFTLSKTKVNVDLVLLSASQLGFAGEQAAVADIHVRARQLGLELCPAEIGPQLRLQYLDQPVGDFVRIAMEPIATYGGVLVDFTVANGGASLVLLGGYAQADTIVHPNVRFVFVRPIRTVRHIAP